MMASYFLVSARVRAAEGISKAPGTRMILMSLVFAPHCVNPSTALCNSRSVINALKRATTIPKRFPEACSLPSSAFGRSLDGDFKIRFLLTPTHAANQKLILVDPRRSVAEVYKLFGFGLLG